MYTDAVVVDSDLSGCRCQCPTKCPARAASRSAIEEIVVAKPYASHRSVGLITPPVGLNVFVIKSVSPPGVTLEKVFKGVAWFLVLDLLVLLLIVMYPSNIFMDTAEPGSGCSVWIGISTIRHPILILWHVRKDHIPSCYPLMRYHREREKE